MRRLVVGVVLAFAVAGCGGDPKADPSPTPSSPSSSTTPAAPVMPEAAKANTKAGAVAFVKYYVELINHAQATGDVGALAAVEDPGCKSCGAARAGVLDLYQAGGSISGGDWDIAKLSVVRNEAIRGWVVDLKVQYGKQVVSYGTTKPDQVNDPGQMVVSVQVRRSTTWKVLEWTRGS